MGSGIKNTHNGACAKAEGEQCACSGCGGSRHGWVGWVGPEHGLARPEQSARRAEKRRRQEKDQRDYYKKKRSKPTVEIKRIVMDLLRFDIANCLGAGETSRMLTDGTLHGVDHRPSKPSTSRGAYWDGSLATVTEVEHSAQAPDAAETSGSVVETPDGGASTDNSEDEVLSSEQADRPADLDDGPGNSAGAGTDRSSPPSPAEQLNRLAEAMASEPFDGLFGEMEGAYSSDEIKAVRKLLTNHFWCTLFLAFAEAVSTLQEHADKIPAFVKTQMSAWLAQPGKRDAGPLAQWVVEKLVDRAWAGLKSVISLKFPVVGLVLSAETVRALRILAMFSCPVPRRHPGMTQHAVRPLMEDGANLVSEEVRRQLVQTFVELADERPSADGGAVQ